MKKLLFKLFPTFFTINVVHEVEEVTNYIDTSKLEGGNKKFKVYHVDPDNEHMHEGLGISEEQVAMFTKQVKMAILDSKNTIDAMTKMEPYIKHANEFYLVSIMLYTEVQKMHGGGPGGPGGLLAALLAAGGPPRGEN
jgi:hypothetical protein